jgi:hypothetical protein
MSRRGSLVLAALLLSAAGSAETRAKAPDVADRTGQWSAMFAPDVARAIGRQVNVDVASIAVNGTARSFRQAAVLLRDESAFARGTTIYALRTVDCQSGITRDGRWSAVAPDGSALGGSAASAQSFAQVRWDSADGKVLRFVCQGILPR